MAVSRTRHLAKALTWRVLASCETFLLAWIFTREIETSAAIMGVEMFSKTALYYLHERAWYGFKWGVSKDDASSSKPAAAVESTSGQVESAGADASAAAQPGSDSPADATNGLRVVPISEPATPSSDPSVQLRSAE